MKIKKGDTILVKSGKDKGKKGKVESVNYKTGKVLVPEVNTYKRHVKKNDAFPQGGVVELSRPLNASSVVLVCPKCDKPSRLGYKMVEGEKKRVCKKCSSAI